MAQIPLSLKNTTARLMRLPLVNIVMRGGIRLTVPRHRIGVTLVAFDDEQRVLLLRHVFHPYVPWGLPGGWLGRHEDPVTGARRELREETGLTADVGPVVHAAHDPDPPHLTLAFLAQLHPGHMTLSSEIIEASWFALDRLPKLFAFMHEAIRRAATLQKSLTEQERAALYYRSNRGGHVV